MYRLEKITKKYKENVALVNVNLEFPQCGLVLLQGENGSGKTTLLNIISNRISFEGKHNFELKDIFYVFNLEPIYDNLSLDKKAKLLIDLNRYDEFLELLKKYNLYDLLTHKVKTLSNGERQKTDLLIARCSSSKVILLDEPLEYIDVNSKPIFSDFIYELGKEALVIETVHNYLHKCDIHYLVANHEIILVDKTNKENTIDHIYKKRNLSLFKTTVYAYNFRKKLSLYLTSLILSVLVFLLTFSICYKKVNSTDIKKNVLVSTTNDLFYYTENSDLVTQVPYILQDIDKCSVELNKTATIKLIVRDQIYYNGEIIKLKDDDIYISDYIYNCIRYDYDVYNKDVYSPKNVTNTYNTKEVKVDFLDKIKYEYNVKIYDTNFENYLVSANKNSNEQKAQAEELRNRVDHFYKYAFVNSKMAQNIINPFINKNIKDHILESKSKYAIDIFYNKEKIRFELYNFPGSYLTDDEFYCDVYFSNLIFNKNNIDLTENDKLKIADKYLKPKAVPTIIYGKGYHTIYLSYNNMCKLSDFLVENNFQDYCLEYVPALKNEVKENPSLLSDTELEETLNLFNEQYLYQKNNYDLFRNTNETIFTVTVVLLSIVIFGYFTFIFRPKYKIDKILLCKGYSKFKFYTSIYALDIILLVILLAVSFLVCFNTFTSILGLLGVLV